ncbi:hypothetical protein [Hymenobacter actinosclerus]|uniref:Uncharacterized protein n=1 Tax=Hymenobacter actinosclerus TaxID=82805 RepID=A0A1I0GXD6_9BACT|nr:hypothetical protein [Hymenobacter actinosclerus]SET75006.1 hypothetical protein SAMN04487998_2600 [Hymenobacter actinosclerus]
MRRSLWLLLRLLLLVRLPALPVAAQQLPPPPDTIAVPYRLRQADCALFPAAATLPPELAKLAPSPGRFTPTRRDVRTAEKALRRVSLARVNAQLQPAYYAQYPALIQQHLADYRRQYFGFVNPEGHRCLFLNLFIEQREEVLGSVPFWLRQAVWTYDGGSAYWSICYDLTTHSFYDFRHNDEG